MTVDQLIEPIRHSPLLPRIVEELQRQVAREQQIRSRFYAEMTPDQKVEFIDGKVLFHSPAKNRHVIATGCIFRAMSLFVEQKNLESIRKLLSGARPNPAKRMHYQIKNRERKPCS